MKKLVYILMMFIIAFSACDPNEDVYDELDLLIEPYSASVEYTFTSDDYAEASDYAKMDAVSLGDTDSSFAKQVGSMEAFNTTYTANDYVGLILSDLYPEYNQSSTAIVTYNSNIGGLDYLNNFGSADAYELVEADYDSMGEEYGEPGYYNNFSSYEAPEDYLPTFLLNKYPAAVADDMIIVTYYYYPTGDIGEYYSFDGTEWAPVPGVYSLIDDDYESMGGYPAANSRFAYYDGDGPEEYLPTFLKLKFPYSVVGEAKVVIYDYYEGDGVENSYAKEYHFDGSGWTEYTAVIEETNQFVHNGEKWLFDPTVSYIMLSADYQNIVDNVEARFGSDLIDSYGTADFYYGAGSYYSNFSISDGYFDGEAFESWEVAVEEAIGTIVLPDVFPNAQLQSNGVDMYYLVTFGTYGSGANLNWSMKFQVTKAGPDPEFTLTEGPTEL